MPPITPFLWFDDQAEEAANHYVSIFPNSRIVSVSHYGEAGPGRPGHPFTDATSFVITCPSQTEVDAYWRALTDGGEEGPCGWCTDRYGLRWQVVPEGMSQLFSDPDPGRGQRAMAAMLQMRKLDIDALRAAADGPAVGSNA